MRFAPLLLPLFKQSQVFPLADKQTTVREKAGSEKAGFPLADKQTSVRVKAGLENVQIRDKKRQVSQFLLLCTEAVKLENFELFCYVCAGGSQTPADYETTREVLKCRLWLLCPYSGFSKCGWGLGSKCFPSDPDTHWAQDQTELVKYTGAAKHAVRITCPQPLCDLCEKTQRTLNVVGCIFRGKLL